MVWVFLGLLAVGLTFIAYVVNSTTDRERKPFGGRPANADDLPTGVQGTEKPESSPASLGSLSPRGTEWPIHGTVLNPNDDERPGGV